jgi:hypothetical protein
MDILIKAGNSLAQQLEKILEFPDQAGFLKQQAAINAIQKNIAVWREESKAEWISKNTHQEQKSPIDFEQDSYDASVSLTTSIAMLKSVAKNLYEDNNFLTLDEVSLLVEETLERLKKAADLNQNCAYAYCTQTGEMNRIQNEYISLTQRLNERPPEDFFVKVIECALSCNDSDGWRIQAAILGNTMSKFYHKMPELKDLFEFWVCFVRKGGGQVEEVTMSSPPYFFMDEYTSGAYLKTADPRSIPKSVQLKMMLSPVPSQVIEEEVISV